jgi:hypothetical protein
VITDVKDITSFKWATVTAIGPLRIRLDGDTAALLLTPETTIDPALLAVNDRVRVELSLRKVIVHGKAGGDGYYTPAQLNAGQLDTRYYSETEIDAMFNAGKVGFKPVGPSSMTVSAGSATINADKTVTLASSRGTIFNGLFATGRRRYLCRLKLTGPAGAYVYVRFAAAGVATTLSLYSGGGLYRQGSAIGYWTGIGNNLATAGVGYSSGSTASSYVDLEIMDANGATGCQPAIRFLSAYSNTNRTSIWGDWHYAATAPTFDGLWVYCDTDVAGKELIGDVAVWEYAR